jgi:hypothetical protein
MAGLGLQKSLQGVELPPSVKMTIGCEKGTIPQTGVPYNAYDIQSFCMQEITINLLHDFF